MTKSIAEGSAKALFDRWGGRFPSWDEFREAARSRGVQVNQTIALEAGNFRDTPKAEVMFWGGFVLTCGFLAVPGALVFWLLFGGPIWAIPAGFIGAYILVKASRQGLCRALLKGALRSRDLYEAVVPHGAFMFAPPDR